MPDYVLSVAQAERANTRRPDPKFGVAAVALARKQWKTTEAILKVMGYTAHSKNNTLRLLEDGRGSDRAARSLYDALKKAGADMSVLPPMYPGDESDAQQQTWREQWALIGDLLHDHAPPIFEVEFEKLLTFARAVARQIGAEVDLGRAT